MSNKPTKQPKLYRGTMIISPSGSMRVVLGRTPGKLWGLSASSRYGKIVNWRFLGLTEPSHGDRLIPADDIHHFVGDEELFKNAARDATRDMKRTGVDFLPVKPKDDPEFIPYGPLWQAEMMKNTKAFIITMLRDALLKLEGN